MQEPWLIKIISDGAYLGLSPMHHFLATTLRFGACPSLGTLITPQILLPSTVFLLSGERYTSALSLSLALSHLDFLVFVFHIFGLKVPIFV